MPRVFVKSAPEAAHVHAAKMVLQRVRTHAERRNFVLMVSPTKDVMAVAKVLVQFHKDKLLSFENVSICVTHEGCGVAKGDPSSSHSIVWHGLLKSINIKPQNVLCLDGEAANFQAECDEFEARVQNAGVDLALVSPGPEGWVGLNIEGSCINSATRVKTLSVLRETQHSPAVVRGMTIGMKTLLDAREMVAIATGPESLKAMVVLTSADIGHMNPLSAFHFHQKLTILSDDTACGEMKQGLYKYFKHLETNPLHNVEAEQPIEDLATLDYDIPTSKGSGVLRLTNIKLLRDGELVDDDLWVRNGKVIDPAARFWEAHATEEFAAETVVDGCGAICSAGLIDIQINGAFGVDFSDVTLTTDQVNTVSQGVLSHGCTSICPTVITSAPEHYRDVLPLLGKREGGKATGANLLGVHLEGPFLSELKYGAHRKEYVTAPKGGFMDAVQMYSKMDSISIVTLAPELEGAKDTIRELSNRGIRCSLGHSNATLDEAEAGVAAGATLVTHLFNAMRTFSHRDPGLVGILASKIPNRPHFGIIVDGLHTHPASVRMAYQTHTSGLVLVTDAMEAMGMPPGKYKLAGKSVDVVAQRLPERYGGVLVHKATLTGTNTLAGAVPTLIECVRNLMCFTNCSAAQALTCASLHPAIALGLQHKKGHLGYGADADFVLFDPATLTPLTTYVAGEQCWTATQPQTSSKL
eukprot:TRINITY_DN8566_c0_g1_i1.p1 TRINITY_DN8566_c0_g1~~TRINITY_DN8566_c0_g1_i1.p1  ORF type:complete len:695 (+),score=233.07 TRINITY_DN8566_c0_g1_i1:61-2145(+)